MMKHLLTAFLIFLGFSLVTLTANAEDTSTSTTPASTSAAPPPASSTDTKDPSEVSKDTWLKSIAPLLPDLICKGFLNDPQLKKRLDDIKMNFEQCSTAIPESVSKCQTELYSKIPDKINNDSASVWGKTLGECIGKDFALKYLVPKS